MRRTWLIAVLLLGACAPRTGLAPAPDAAVDPDMAAVMTVGRQTAFFATYPDMLLTAAFEACANPGQRPVRPAPDEVRCETLPTPEAAASLILTYEGTIEALPLFIVSFAAEPAPGGYLVTADNYIAVPQRNGQIREVRLSDARLDANMRALLEAAGGESIPPTGRR
jgi:hypothetical protein